MSIDVRVVEFDDIPDNIVTLCPGYKIARAVVTVEGVEHRTSMNVSHEMYHTLIAMGLHPPTVIAKLIADSLPPNP
jgi:hypothetical protein